MSYLSKDEQILIKIQKYIVILRRLYGDIESLPSDELDESIEALALSQCMTNLFELSSKISDDTVADKLNILSSGRIAGFRNIASHDYDSINWNIAKKNCKMVLTVVTEDCINECFEFLAEKKANTKDYTKISSNPYEISDM